MVFTGGGFNFQNNNAQNLEKALAEAQKLKSAGHFQQAQQMLMGLHQQNPQASAPLHHLGLLFFERSDYPNAENMFSAALARAPLDVENMLQLALTQAHLRKMDEADATIEQALQIDQSPRALLAAGNIARMKGDKKASISYMQRALEKEPEYLPALAILVRAERQTPDSTAFVSLSKLEKKSRRMPVPDQIALHYALGKAYFDMKDYTQGFVHYQRANFLSLKGDPIPKGIMDQTERQAEVICEKFTAEEMKELSKSAQKPAGDFQPIFVTGLLRSGTTLTQQIISAHSDVVSAGEINDFGLAMHKDGAIDNSFEAVVDAFMRPENFIKTGQAYMDSVSAKHPDAKYIVDKMPYNYMWLGLIHLAMPQAKIVLCKRNPMDCGLSLYRQNFMARTPWYNHLKTIGQAYRIFWTYAKHWQKAMGDKLFVLDYDKMVADPETELPKLIKFLGFEWSDDFLKFHQNESVVTTASVDAVRRGINQDSLRIWQHLRDELKPLYDEVKDLGFNLGEVK